MKPSRLDALSDGIFAIVLTLLAFDLRIPAIIGTVTEQRLWDALGQLEPVFVSFVLSYALLFTYWRAHHYIVSVYAKTIDTRLTSINALFFFFISLIPFSARLIGEYSTTKVAILIYGLDVICIGLTLLWMRAHVLSTNKIDKNELSNNERIRGIIRTLVPVICAAAAIVLSFISPTLSIILFTFSIVFNLMAKSPQIIDWLVETLSKNIA